MNRSTFVIFFALLFFVGPVHFVIRAQPAASGFDEPVIAGMAPDPSVCRVGDDY
jgi:hypothetical protein